MAESEKGRRISVVNDRSKSDHVICGVIMPISATENHTDEQWIAIQTLVHRGISLAGFTPQNVWENISTDRISERIIGNIFNFPLAVADISDLNPNVMLELGLRLASKKPTIVIVNEGGTIPFDIRDFHAIFYPADMNMLEMEEFFNKLSKALKDKHNAYSSSKYTPFLSNVIVDVASPETRELGLNDLIISKLEDMSQRLQSVESIYRQNLHIIGQSSNRIRTLQPSESGRIIAEIPDDNVDSFSKDAMELYEIDKFEISSLREGFSQVILYYSGGRYSSVHSLLAEIAAKYGGEMEVPF